MARIKDRIQGYVDSVASAAAGKAAKEASAEMVYELIAQLQTIGKDQEALAIVDRLGEVYFSYARLTWDGRLTIPRDQFMMLDTAKYEKGHDTGADVYVSERLDVDGILADLGRCGFEVVSSHPAGNGFSFFLKKRLYSRPKATK